MIKAQTTNVRDLFHINRVVHDVQSYFYGLVSNNTQQNDFYYLLLFKLTSTELQLSVFNQHYASRSCFIEDLKQM